MGKILVFHVQLAGVTPVVWRRLAVRAEKSFWHLHCAIQDAMPWDDTHLHEFRFPSGDEWTRIGIPDDAGFDDERRILASWGTALTDWFIGIASQCSYLYDFGDGWVHKVVLEAHLPAEPRGRYPRCLAGEQRCPPEDVGGPGGYARFLAALANRFDSEHESYRQWIGGPWDPGHFRLDDVVFSKPSERLRRAGLG
jgi:hypothetical protein